MEENKNPACETPDETVTETAEEETVETPETETAPEPEVAEEKVSGKDKKKWKKAEAELSELKKSLEKKDGELAELNDKYLRLCAEYDNFRKRSAKEREGIYADACADALEKILPVLDNLERAALYNTEEVAETPVGKGLELTLKSFAETLSQLGVHEIEALGKPFDPNLHNAVMHVDDESYGENEVIEVLMKGYAKGDKVLRYAMVKVAN
ncbi:MAG: nucleotide exchange factor GrpE [Clostridia bacterium]|nr:nucleotide exchange factor GrpE [Clostridia bacterium]